MAEEKKRRKRYKTIIVSAGYNNLSDSLPFLALADTMRLRVEIKPKQK